MRKARSWLNAIPRLQNILYVRRQSSVRQQNARYKISLSDLGIKAHHLDIQANDVGDNFEAFGSALGNSVFEKAREECIVEMFEEERAGQILCREKIVGLSFPSNILVKFVWPLFNKVKKPRVIFFVSAGQVDRYTKRLSDMFSSRGIDVKQTHWEWVLSLWLLGRADLLFHCTKRVLRNPVTSGFIKVASFAFDDSVDLARKASSFAQIALGTESGMSDAGADFPFFRDFYAKLLEGNSIRCSYQEAIANGVCALRPFWRKDVGDIDCTLFPKNDNAKR